MMATSHRPEDRPPLIDPSATPRGAWSRGWWALTGPLLSRVLCFREINAAYARSLASAGEPGNYFDHALEALGVRYEILAEDLLRIPSNGPLVTVSNHPFGGLDGVVLGALLMRRRTDFKLLVNRLLARIEPLRPHAIAVDVFGGEGAARSNLGPMRESLRFLRAGGALGLFPSGTVSHFQVRSRQVTDPPWVSNLGGVIRRGGATVVPIYFEGRNSRLFQFLGLLHPRLRTALLGRELIHPTTRVIRVRVGHAIPAARLARFEDDVSLMGFLRLKTYILQNRKVAEKTSFRTNWRRRNVNEKNARKPIVARLGESHLQSDIDRLPADQCLVAQGEYRVYFARAGEIPHLLQEIGRLREATFRAVGEGTGLSSDLDRFDQFYVHLFMWNRDRRELVGAYRLGPTDEILSRHGPQGLYTTTLFRYKPGVLARLSPALELGRSFVVGEYQRKHVSLSLIWRGIGQFIARFPRYRILFGPVSISNDYQNLSRNLIVTYLRENTLDPDFSRGVRGRKSPRSRYFGRLDRGSFSASIRDIEDVSALISEIEREERGVPVLLRQYLKLNATMLSFNVDPEFSNSLDGLVLVDLFKTNEATLGRYMGAEGMKRFHAYHRLPEPAPAAAVAAG